MLHVCVEPKEATGKVTKEVMQEMQLEVPAAAVEVCEWTNRRGLMVQCFVADSDSCIYPRRTGAVTEETLGRITLACYFENDQL